MKRRLTADEADKNFKLKGYFKNKTWDTTGKLNKAEYFEDAEMSKLRIRETMEYSLVDNDVLQVVQTKKIEWFDGYGTDEDVNKNYEKTRVKIFTPEDGLDFNESCRNRVINNAKVYMVNTLGVEIAIPLLFQFTDDIDFYVGGFKTPLLENISTSTNEALTTEIKAKLDEILNV